MRGNHVQSRTRYSTLLALPVLASACTAHIQAEAPPPVVSIHAEAATAPPPAPPAEPAPAPPEAPAPPAEPAVAADAEVEPVTDADPEEVQATTEPPDPVYEEQTDVPGPGYVWIGGYWGWNGVDWNWYWGRWDRPPEGRIYIQPYYERVGGRVVYVHGYWGPPNAPARAYGGERIRFTAAVRPANYHRGEHIVVEHRVGPRPGTRPGGVYVHATGTVRALPTRTAPTRRVAAVHTGPTPRSDHAEAHAAARDERAAHHDEAAAHRDEAAAHHEAVAAHRDEAAARRDEAAAHHEEVTAHHEEVAAHHEEAAAHHEEAAAHHQEVAAHHEEHGPAGAHPPPQHGPPAKSPPPKRK